MRLSGRERFLVALANQKPDRLPCQIYRWSDFQQQELSDAAQYAAYARIGMEPVIYCAPRFSYTETAQTNWQLRRRKVTPAPGCGRQWSETVTTPDGKLVCRYAADEISVQVTEPLLKTEADFELWNKHVPVPAAVDWSPVINVKQRIEEDGIVRGRYFDFGQGSPWQSFCTLFGVSEAQRLAAEKRDWVHQALESMLRKKLRVIEIGNSIDLDIVETGGACAGSLTPEFYREFCLPYDKRQHAALKSAGTKSVYHIRGPILNLLDLLAQSGAQGLEPLTPKELGGDCDLAAARAHLGERTAILGGLDARRVFQSNARETAAQTVRELHRSLPAGGYICAAAEEYLRGPDDELKAFGETVKTCTYY